jgi:hypothetical protein
MKANRGAASRLPEDFNVAPANATAPAGSQRLHGCFFGGKARGEAFDAIGFRIAISDLLFGENPAQEPVAESLDGFSDSRDFGDVNSRADDHADTLARDRVGRTSSSDRGLERSKQPVPTVNYASLDDPRLLHQRVWFRRFGVVYVQHLMPVRNEPIGNQHAMAAEVHALRTHVRDA